jgi:hypothetical protein
MEFSQKNFRSLEMKLWTLLNYCAIKNLENDPKEITLHNTVLGCVCEEEKRKIEICTTLQCNRKKMKSSHKDSLQIRNCSCSCLCLCWLSIWMLFYDGKTYCNTSQFFRNTPEKRRKKFEWETTAIVDSGLWRNHSLNCSTRRLTRSVQIQCGDDDDDDYFNQTKQGYTTRTEMKVCISHSHKRGRKCWYREVQCNDVLWMLFDSSLLWHCAHL